MKTEKDSESPQSPSDSEKRKWKTEMFISFLLTIPLAFLIYLVVAVFTNITTNPFIGVVAAWVGVFTRCYYNYRRHGDLSETAFIKAVFTSILVIIACSVIVTSILFAICGRMR